MKNEWCEHIRIATDGSYNCNIGSMSWYFNDSSIWKFCPICGTPRPEPMSLAGVVLAELKKQGIDLEHMGYAVDDEDLEKAIKSSLK